MIVKNIKINLSEKMVLFRLGYKLNQKLNSKIEDRVKNLLKMSSTMIEPIYTYSDRRIKVKDSYIVLDDGIKLKSKSIFELLKNSQIITIFFATIGSRIENETNYQFKNNNQVESMIYDAIGSELVDELANIVQKNTKARARRSGYKITRRFSPGYGDFKLSEQKTLAKICNAEEIGIKVTRVNTMLPRKTVSAIIGWERITNSE
jgi:cobalamin-dependent methionine synthase I